MRSPRVLAAAAARHLLSPFLPARKKLPLYYWLDRLSGTCGPELSRLDEFILKTGTAIDIGANGGLFTYALSRRFERVYAFEANHEVVSPIVEYNQPNVTLYRCGLSSASRAARLYIPVVNGLALSGWGSFDCDNLPGASDFIERDVEVRALDEFGISGVDFIKIDVEGHEIEVLNGAAATIEQWRPLVLCEVKDWHLETANAWFRARNFNHRSLDEFFNLRHKNANHLYVPAERMSRLEKGS